MELLVETRINAGLTQVELADKLDMSQSGYSKFERGQRRLDLLQLHTICRKMKVSLSDFVAEFERRVEPKRKAKRTR